MSVDQRRRNRALLLGTFLLFFLPVVGAWLLNVLAPGWLPFGTTNHGTLVQPVRPVDAARLEGIDGAPLAADFLSGRWTLVHLSGHRCDDDCLHALARSRQVQQALGEDRRRVQILLVLAAGAPPPAGDAPAGATVAVADRDWLRPFAFDATAPTPGIYLVDPQGYLMMRYPRDVAQRDLISDLERLLKISKIG